MSATDTPSPISDTPTHRYTGALAQEIELRWQAQWDADGAFCSPNPTGPLGDPVAVAGRPKKFILDMFPLKIIRSPFRN